VLGHDCQRESIRAPTAHGATYRDLRLYENLTGRQLFGMFASMHGAKPVQAYAAELCHRLALDPTLKIGSLSKGTHKRPDWSSS
jgi:ABC-type multidrug transport system ATPase subunit